MQDKREEQRDLTPQDDNGRRPFGRYEKTWQAILRVEDDTLPTEFRVTLARGRTLRGCHIAPALGPEGVMCLVYSGNREVLGLKNCGSRPWQADRDGCVTRVEPGTVLVLPLAGDLVLTFPEAPGIRVRFLGFDRTAL